MSRTSRIEEAFLEDHRGLTRCFYGMLRALEADDWDTAFGLAEEVDRLAGPHIEFEERFLYPEVGRVRGEEYAARLHREHEIALDALRTLLECREKGLRPYEQKSALISQIRAALEHAMSCGTLLSHLTTLDSRRQEALANKLLALRRAGHRWTDKTRGG